MEERACNDNSSRILLINKDAPLVLRSFKRITVNMKKWSWTLKWIVSVSKQRLFRYQKTLHWWRLTWVRYFKRQEPFGKSRGGVHCQKLFKPFNNINRVLQQTETQDLTRSNTQPCQILTKSRVLHNGLYLMS